MYTLCLVHGALWSGCMGPTNIRCRPVDGAYLPSTLIAGVEPSLPDDALNADMAKGPAVVVVARYGTGGNIRLRQPSIAAVTDLLLQTWRPPRRRRQGLAPQLADALRPPTDVRRMGPGQGAGPAHRGALAPARHGARM